VNDPVVYRTTDPEVLAAYRKAGDALEAYVAAVRAVLDAHGVGSYWIWADTGWSPAMFRGIVIPGGEEPPRGWRIRGECAVPHKSTSAGRAVDTALKAVAYPGNPRGSLKGMPVMALTGLGLAHPRVEFLGQDAALYVTWRTDPECGGEVGRGLDRSVDRTLWERIPLSVYYLAREAAPEAGDGS
jgi:hypothetical protein